MGQQTTVLLPSGRGGHPLSFTVHGNLDNWVNKPNLPAGTTFTTSDATVDLYTLGVETGRKIGYVRVSKTEQETALQLAAMHGQGCTLIFEEKRSSVSTVRPALDACLDELKPNDTLVVWKLDRLGRTMLKLLTLIEDLEKRSIHFLCTTQGMDTGTPMGKLMLGVLAAFAEFERNTIIERTNAGLEAAREKGHFGGGRRALVGDELDRARQAYHHRPVDPRTGKPMSVRALAAAFGVSKITFQNWVLHDGVPTWKAKRDALLAREPDLDAWRERTNDPSWGLNPGKRAS